MSERIIETYFLYLSQDDWTPLHHAANGSLSAVETLLEHNASVSAVTHVSVIVC